MAGLPPRASVKLGRSTQCSTLVRELRGMEDTCDLVFNVDGVRMSAHRTWISVSSPVLYKMIRSVNGSGSGKKKKGKSLDVITLENVKASTWRMVLDYLYYEDLDLDCVEQAVELLACSRKYSIVNMERDVIQFLVSRAFTHTQAREFDDGFGCCDLLLAAKLLNNEELKSKALQVMQKEFVSISGTSASASSFALLDIDMLEEIVQSENLNVRSELDILEAIISWCAQNGYAAAAVKDEPSSKSDDTCSSGSSGSIECIKKELRELKQEDVDRLSLHVRINDLSLGDLKAMAIMCREAKLIKLYIKCMNRFLVDARRAELSTPILPEQRAIHKRTAPVISITHRFHSVFSAMEHDSKLHTAWTWDALMKYRWQLEVEFDETEKKIKVHAHVEEKDIKSGEELLCQLFILHPADGKGTTFSCDPVKFNLTSATTVCSLPEVDYEKCRKLVDKSSDSLVLGATVYFTTSD